MPRKSQDSGSNTENFLSNGSVIAVGCGVVVGAALAATAFTLYEYRKHKISRHCVNLCHDNTNTNTSSYESLIGNTPMVELVQLSKLLERRILVKMESMNPGGTGKDRAALGMIQAAEQSGQLPTSYDMVDKCSKSGLENGNEGFDATILGSKSDKTSRDDVYDGLIVKAIGNTRRGLVVEGTSGSTGIALANLCATRGHACLVVMPDDQAVEKQRILVTLGAVVHVVPTASIANPMHYVNIARQIAERACKVHNIKAVFINQFDNLANFETHYRDTGPEIYRQCPQIDAFCMSAGTGGTIAGTAKYLKEQRQNIKIVLVDPPGSVLYHKITYGVAFTHQQAERVQRKHRYDTLAEGIGLDRITENLAVATNGRVMATTSKLQSKSDSCNRRLIDFAIMVTDQEAVDMAHWLLKHEGLWVGSSSAMNIVAAIRTARDLPKRSTVVTIVCDGGQRHVTRFWNQDFVETTCGLVWPNNQDERIPECLQDLL